MIIPDDLFFQLLSKTDLPVEDCTQIHNLSLCTLDQDNASILLYESAISDFLATSEVDFFNIKFILAQEEKLSYLDYLLKLNAKGNLRLIKDGFYPEFKHLLNPSIYLSETICYIRVEKAYERENIFEIIDATVKQQLADLYNELWSNRLDVIIKDVNIIKTRLMKYRQMTSLISAC